MYFVPDLCNTALIVPVLTIKIKYVLPKCPVVEDMKKLVVDLTRSSGSNPY
jgi:hypothetical protein